MFRRPNHDNADVYVVVIDFWTRKAGPKKPL